MGRIARIATLGALGAAALCAAPIAPSITARHQAPPRWLGGIQVNEPDPTRWTASLERAGLNTVSVTVYAHQGDWDSATLWYADDEPAVVAEIRAARARGLHVVLILRVALDHAFPRNAFLWHGMIMPRDEAALDEWFRRYGEFAERWARIAETEGVDLLGIGSEMKSLAATLPITHWGDFQNVFGFRWYQRRLRQRTLEFADEIERRHLRIPGHDGYEDLESFVDRRREANLDWARQAYLRDEPGSFGRINARRRRILSHWNRVIDSVRARYSGLLTYAANFDNFDNVGFWDRLDVMGINAYFPLREYNEGTAGPAAESAIYRRSWERIFDRVVVFQRGHALRGRPLLFTELGYTAGRNSTVEPWSHEGFSVVGWTGRPHFIVWGEQPRDPGERRRALQALDEVSRRRDDVHFAGLLYWKLSTDPAHERIEPFVITVDEGSRDAATLAAFAARRRSRVSRPASNR